MQIGSFCHALCISQMAWIISFVVECVAFVTRMWRKHIHTRAHTHIQSITNATFTFGNKIYRGGCLVAVNPSHGKKYGETVRDDIKRIYYHKTLDYFISSLTPSHMVVWFPVLCSLRIHTFTGAVQRFTSIFHFFSCLWLTKSKKKQSLYFHQSKYIDLKGKTNNFPRSKKESTFQSSKKTVQLIFRSNDSSSSSSKKKKKLLIYPFYTHTDTATHNVIPIQM